MVRGSMAFVSDPQTSVEAFGARASASYFNTFWEGWDREALLQAFPERFDMARHYQNMNPENYVYYAQNSSDFSHVRKHLNPFKEANGIPLAERAHRGPRRAVQVYDGSVEGHGAIQPDEFSTLFNDAVESWRGYRELLR